ncbi:hypothetical protein CI109_100243 [Kwoniella shandongensis]|uniref:Xylanolytic transcriptional activator regulatory domain-containing protein n=1 Tax=Kwoniella shandongensis TaxID=1734106 RepID=A0AAJ8LFB0_9TREE
MPSSTMPGYATDLSLPPPTSGVIPIDIAPSGSSNNNSSQSQLDVAGVLRRNQACLQCRKRKLVRPHCATCVRSYRHLLRTAPKSNPVLCCDYEDGAPHQEDTDNARVSNNSASPPDQEDDDGSGKKKRKAAGEGKRKKKNEEFEDERLRLQKKIDELQAQLTTKQQSGNAAGLSTSTTGLPQQTWTDSGSSQFPINPTNPSNPLFSTIAPGLNQTTLWGGDTIHIAQSQNSQPFKETFNYEPPAPQKQTSRSTFGQTTPSSEAADNSRRSSDIAPDITSSSSVPNMLSPNGVFNFSPGETFSAPWPPIDVGDTTFAASATLNASWQMGGNTAPLTTGMKKPDSIGVDDPMETDINLDGLQAGLDAAMQQQLLMDLFWPGWPPNLPEPNVVNDLIEAFFDLVPNLPRVLHRARFLARMALPPTHSNFPHPALIHAVCTAAASWCSPSVYEKSALDKYYSSTGDAASLNGGKNPLSFGLRQANYAKVAVREGLDTGNRLFDVVRAMIILSRVYIDDTRMLECWAYCGLVARMILPLGLNVRSAELSLKSVMLPPPADALEREERRAATWMAFYHDTIASSASGWGTSMALDELTVALPVSAVEFELGLSDMEPDPQDLEAPDFWIKHPVVDAFVMVLKATVLINRVNRFVRKWKNRHLRPGDDFDGLEKPEFKELANAIACFQMSFPNALRNYCKLTPKRRFNIDLIAAHMLPHAAAICLFEPFADLTDENDLPRRRLLSATQGIVSIVQNLASVVGEGGSNFTSVMHPSASVCLVTAARTSLLFLRQALNVGDHASAQAHKMDCEMVRMALSQFGMRFKIGHHHAQLIEYFLDRALNPSFEKLRAHYPDHPRLGAPELHANADFGACVANALNIKRGYWRIHPHSGSSTTSPFGSTPDSGFSRTGAYPPSSTNTSVSNNLHPVESRSPTNGKQSARADSADHGFGGFTMTEEELARDLLEKKRSGADLGTGSEAAEDLASFRNETPSTEQSQSLPHTRPINISPVNITAEKLSSRTVVRGDGHMSILLSLTEDEVEAQYRQLEAEKRTGTDMNGEGYSRIQTGDGASVSGGGDDASQRKQGQQQESEIKDVWNAWLGDSSANPPFESTEPGGNKSGMTSADISAMWANQQVQPQPGGPVGGEGVGPGAKPQTEVSITTLCRKTIGNKN